MPNPPDSLLRHSEELAAMRGELTPLERELLDALEIVTRRLSDLDELIPATRRNHSMHGRNKGALDVARAAIARAQAAEKPAD